MPVLILTFKDDSHIDGIRPHLDEEPIVVDFQEIADGTMCSFNFAKGKLEFIHNGRVLRNISGVWLRRPRHAKYLRLPVIEQHDEYSRSALERFTATFYSAFPKSIWVSDYYAIRRANNKPLQQRLAAQVGFAVPDTVYTNDPEAVRQFARSHDDIVIKGMAYSIPITKGGQLQNLYTRKVSHVEDLRLEGLHLAPSIFQQAIKVRREYRVTIVGQEAFSIAVDSNASPEGIRDWRYGDLTGDIAYSAVSLPRDTEAKCLAITQRFGLNYGALDIIEDTQGTFWFLEINPNGQWAFVEHYTGLPIRSALAQLLQDKAPVLSKPLIPQ